MTQHGNAISGEQYGVIDLVGLRGSSYTVLPAGTTLASAHQIATEKGLHPYAALTSNDEFIIKIMSWHTAYVEYFKSATYVLLTDEQNLAAITDFQAFEGGSDVEQAYPGWHAVDILMSSEREPWIYESSKTVASGGRVFDPNDSTRGFELPGDFELPDNLNFELPIFVGLTDAQIHIGRTDTMPGGVFVVIQPTPPNPAPTES